MTFNIHFPDGHRETYTNHYDESDEQQRDAAFDDAYTKYPHCYVEES